MYIHVVGHTADVRDNSIYTLTHVELRRFIKDIEQHDNPSTYNPFFNVGYTVAC